MGDPGADPPVPPPAPTLATPDILLDGDLLIIFSPRARFILLLGVITTTGLPPTLPPEDPEPDPVGKADAAPLSAAS